MIVIYQPVAGVCVCIWCGGMGGEITIGLGFFFVNKAIIILLVIIKIKNIY